MRQIGRRQTEGVCKRSSVSGRRMPAVFSPFDRLSIQLTTAKARAKGRERKGTGKERKGGAKGDRQRSIAMASK